MTAAMLTALSNVSKDLFVQSRSRYYFVESGIASPDKVIEYSDRRKPLGRRNAKPSIEPTELKSSPDAQQAVAEGKPGKAIGLAHRDKQAAEASPVQPSADSSSYTPKRRR